MRIPVVVTGLWLCFLGLLAAISSGIPNWAQLDYSIEFAGNSMSLDWTGGLYKANMHQERSGVFFGSEKKDDDYTITKGDDDDVFEVNRASTTLLALVLFPGGLVYAALGALGKTLKPVEIAVGLAAVIFGIFGLIGGGYWYKQMDVDDDTFDDDDKGWARSPCTAGCELELFVGATAVFTSEAWASHTWASHHRASHSHLGITPELGITLARGSLYYMATTSSVGDVPVEFQLPRQGGAAVTMTVATTW
ncbi:hypothetical protein JL721_6285 [Aureococcus anophagefferens]|nr:hypothetical protein JL721_6285 [Aureococcus anophagefferens]